MTVIKRGASGRWEFVLEAPPGSDGKRRQVRRRGFRTKEEAKDALKQCETDLADGLPARDKTTLTEYLDRWLEIVKPGCQPRTWASYDDVCRLYLRPVLGHVRLQTLTGLHVEAVLKDARSRGISELRVRYVYRVLSMALRRAVILQLIRRNPCEGVPCPAPLTPEPRVLTPVQAMELLESCEGTWLYLPVLLSITCGLRRGEVLALRWSDVDLNQAVLVVRRATELLKGVTSLKGPKTHQSAAVAIPESVLEDLRLARAAAPPGDGYVVCETDGSLTRPDRLTSRFRRHVKKLGLNIHFHGLRHTQGTLLLASGVPERIAMARMRHRTPEMMHHYAHVLPAMRDDAASRVDAALGRKRRETE